MSGSTCICVLPNSDEKETCERTVYRKDNNSYAINVVGYDYWKHVGPECKKSQRLRSHLQFTPGDAQLKNAVEITYGESLTPGDTIGVDWETGKVMETHNEDGDVVESEEAADVPELWSYLISSENLKE